MLLIIWIIRGGKDISIIDKNITEQLIECFSVFIYPDEIRWTIYTPNAVEIVRRQFRKATKSKSMFSRDEAIKKDSLTFYDISQFTQIILQIP